ncbi:SLC13 family permease [Bifidobacterium choloepi]|uniref:Anion transporter n=1 Tax=Bifidobacterium choloepi TaxID=2614131 RepID=A0A6I5N6L5_9BIFI|nr:SLC13 family permease [Bifidobacterium choloepi]NEG69441.1 anion transporter [Bifidobacterium choloepi]
MGQRLLRVLRSETILVVATLLALISCFIVPPDGEYWGYVHVSTIAQLACLMLVVCGLQRIGVFRIIGSSLLRCVNTARGLAITLIALTFFSAMFITNDVALVTFVPFAIAVLKMARLEDKSIVLCSLMTVAANCGSMLTPIGNAHNLYFKALTGMSTVQFVGVMAPYSAVAAVLLVIASCIVFRGEPVSEFKSMDSEGIERSVLAPNSGVPQPDEIRIMGYGKPGSHAGWRCVVYILLFLLCIATVSDLTPLWLMCVVVFAAFLFTDIRAYRHADWALPLTFIMFFIFIGNMKRVPEFTAIAQATVGAHPLLVAVIFSQFISNVPSTLLLSGFSNAWVPLIIGTNLGGMGTIIASMASLITYKAIAKEYPAKKLRYLGVYMGISFAFLIVLTALALVIEG